MYEKNCNTCFSEAEIYGSLPCASAGCINELPQITNEEIKDFWKSFNFS